MRNLLEQVQRRPTLISYDSGCSLKDLTRVELFKRRTLRFKYRGLKSSRSSVFAQRPYHGRMTETRPQVESLEELPGSKY